MSDLIRRGEALKALLKVPCKIDSDNYTWIRLSDAFGTIDEDVPSAEPEPKWIPVTEALPEEETDVLVTVHFDGHKVSTVDYLPPSDYVEIASHVDGLWSSLSDEYKIAWNKHHVVAWMETPEPWRGE